MGRFAIVAYRPKPGMERALLAAVDRHLAVLTAEDLVTERPAYVMRGTDGVVIEVFEWRSAEAIRAAHDNAAVKALWGEFAAACDYLPLSELPETRELFAEFDAIEPEQL